MERYATIYLTVCGVSADCTASLRIVCPKLRFSKGIHVVVPILRPLPPPSANHTLRQSLHRRSSFHGGQGGQSSGNDPAGYAQRGWFVLLWQRWEEGTANIEGRVPNIVRFYLPSLPPSSLFHHPSSIIPLSQLLITQLQLSDGQMVRAHMFGQTEKQEKLVLTEEEEAMVEKVRASWSAILSLSNIDENTDFFKSGAGSMDVTR